MADSTTRREVEDWLRSDWFPERYGQGFERRRVRLSTGGEYQFSAVSEDEQIIAVVSTSAATTSSGNLGVGKLQKIRADMLFLMLLDRDAHRVIVLTEQSMYDQMMKEKDAGRVPQCIEFLLAGIPAELRRKLTAAQRSASAEIRQASINR